MPVPASIGDLSVTAASNSPSGADAPSVIDDHLRAHASFIKYLSTGKQFTSEATLASAATVDIGAASSLYVHITGTTTITSFGTDYQGPRFIRFSGALTISHNGTSLILPGNASITTAAGDSCIAIPYTSGWRIVHYQRADGTLVSNASFARSLAANGYQRLPGGLILQWGLSGGANPNSLADVTFPLAFPTAVVNVSLQYVDGLANTGAGRGNPTQVGVLSKAGFNFYHSGTANNCQFFWLAIGY